MFNLPLNLMSNTTQRILSQSNNISYSARGVVRVNATPEDRKADYLLRDFYLVLVTAYLTEIGFRGLETMYTIPLMTKALDLHQLSKWYPGVKNYNRLPDALRGYVLGSLVKSDSIPHVPELMKRMQDMHKGPMSEADRKQAEALIDHLHRRLNFTDYLRQHKVQTGKLSAEDAELVKKGMKKLAELQHGNKGLMDLVQDVLDKPAAERQAALSEGLAKWHELFKLAGSEEQAAFRQMAGQMETMVTAETAPSKGALKKLSSELAELFERNAAQQEGNLGRLEASFLAQHPLKSKLKNFIREGVESETTMAMLKRIQKSGTWPKTITSVALTFVFYGMIANYFDVKILQPWQERIVKERGTSAEVVPPAYKALIPGVGVLVAGLWDKITPKFIQRMGYFNRFAVVGAAALATYTGTMLLMIKQALSKPPKHKAVQPQPPVAQPSYPRPVAENRPAPAPQAQPQAQPHGAMPAHMHAPIPPAPTPFSQTPPPPFFQAPCPGSNPGRPPASSRPRPDAAAAILSGLGA